jgi:hypothetical protein
MKQAQNNGNQVFAHPDLEVRKKLESSLLAHPIDLIQSVFLSSKILEIKTYEGEYKNKKRTQGAEIYVEGVDLLDGTPILDIKPYLPYVDSVPDASLGWADDGLDCYPVHFNEKSLSEIRKREIRYPDLHKFIKEMLEQDPRPASQKRKTPINDPHFRWT